MELAGIGIAIPGPFDYAAGVSRMTHKFRSICGVDLRGVLHAMPGVPADAEIRFMQDVNAALAGEIARGNACLLYTSDAADARVARHGVGLRPEP